MNDTRDELGGDLEIQIEVKVKETSQGKSCDKADLLDGHTDREKKGSINQVHIFHD